ncbi:hypothetical protein ZWY2020_007901 [Hordeum vulgare]|nr:hypothetical protein ZWY2020_007901 [Hordeum vulgare]
MRPPLLFVCPTLRLECVQTIFSSHLPYTRHASTQNSQFHGLLPPAQARRLDEIPLPPSTGPARSGDPPAPIHSAGLVRYSIAPSTKRRTHKRTKEVKGRKD